MALYNKTNFNCARGVYNCESPSTATAIHTFISDTPIANIMTVGYFPPEFGFAEGSVLVNDYIFVQASDGQYQLLVTDMDPVTVADASPSFADVKLTNLQTSAIDTEVLVVDPVTGEVKKRDISTFEDASSINTVAQGPYASPEPCTIGLVKNNRNIIIFFSGVDFLSTSAAKITFPAGILNIPGYVPSASIAQPFIVIDNGASTGGELHLFQNGNIEITKYASGSFTNGTNVGFATQMANYYADPA